MCSSHINHCCPHSRSVVLMPAPQGQGQCCQSQPKVHIHDSPKGFLRQVFPFPTTDAIFSFSFWVQHFFGGKPSLKTLLFSQSWFPPAANQAAVVPVTKVLLATILEGTLQPRLWRKVLEIMFPSTRAVFLRQENLLTIQHQYIPLKQPRSFHYCAISCRSWSPHAKLLSGLQLMQVNHKGEDALLSWFWMTFLFSQSLNLQ